MIPCADHPDTPALGYCRGCRIALCDPCCVFSINDDVWCQACGSAIEEETRPRYSRAAFVLVLGFGLTTAVWLVRAVVLRVYIPYFSLVLLLGYGGSMSLAWNTVHPLFGVERPTVARRRPGSPLPRHARRA
ncbi:MAG: hypothetical protein JST00_45865 [Deltaproteobacteria bacterium]|nr:hypothetical protein [Deltaproteobacteria bacterium]